MGKREQVGALDVSWFHQQMQEWGPTYDIVIMHAAPVLPFSEAHVLGETADLTILSVALGQTSRTTILRALEVLKSHGAANVLLMAEEGSSRGAFESFYGFSLAEVRAG